MKRQLAAVGLLTLASLVHAQGAIVWGGVDCGTWVKSTTPTMKTWLLGYLSGMNIANAPLAKDPLDVMKSAEQAFQWMDSYCRANPLDTVQVGANKLYTELARRAVAR